jgi:hypothetical protein
MFFHFVTPADLIRQHERGRCSILDDSRDFDDRSMERIPAKRNLQRRRRQRRKKNLVKLPDPENEKLRVA